MEGKYCGECINIIYLGNTPSIGKRRSIPYNSGTIKKEILDADKPISVGNIPPLKFAGGTTKQEITGNIQGAWDTDILVSLVTTMGISVEEEL